MAFCGQHDDPQRQEQSSSPEGELAKPVQEGGHGGTPTRRGIATRAGLIDPVLTLWAAFREPPAPWTPNPAREPVPQYWWPSSLRRGEASHRQDGAAKSEGMEMSLQSRVRRPEGRERCGRTRHTAPRRRARRAHPPGCKGPRIQAGLRETDGLPVGRRRVARLMRAADLVSSPAPEPTGTVILPPSGDTSRALESTLLSTWCR
ncbi:transposase [Streptomyces sp. B1-3]|uniref:transposase n=1 Tax=Streptomyces sp. B1-3 TaxID=3141453 RepID=UPI003D2A1D5D